MEIGRKRKRGGKRLDRQ